ncbi:HEAT repeat domain-containing protein [Blastopirellula marina]|uniref:HEAT repeat domain-containing protein n=1 Tax=Blastopirellula marina TaxID=124 RepID=A0A2S8G6M5_9BACT|nr:HEAT repeat domain-containing protein [Blastopirellula marina]PQO40077.1 hypothetical protein C5Y98_07120 [Blastopirellula marina]PTL45452.1 hypothetical protein C5Y97_07120 [Blastopirellula marina]
MLSGLDQVDWKSLSHAYGSAEDVPAQMCKLTSPDKAVWETAIYDFYGNIWHQGTVYEATAYAVPFLLELLAASSIACKTDILYLLKSLANGSSYLDVHQTLDWHRNERKTEEFQAQVREELKYVAAARRAVLEGVPLYLACLTEPDPAMRGAAAYVLGSCCERIAEIFPALRARISVETDSQTVSGVLIAMCHLHNGAAAQTEGTTVENAEGLRENYAQLADNPAKSPVIRMTAALCAIALADTEQEAQRLLPAIRETLAASSEDFTQMAWTEGESPVSLASRTLERFPGLRKSLLLAAIQDPDSTVRRNAIWDVTEFCQQRRSAPEAFAPQLAKLLADPDADVRKWAAQELPRLGQARLSAIAELEQLTRHADRAVRNLAKQTLKEVRKPRQGYQIETWLKRPKRKRRVADLIAILQGTAPNQAKIGEYERAAAAAELEFLGTAAAEAVPALRKGLQEDSQWMRVHAARALWAIAGEVDETLPILKEDLLGRPAGLLALDCLGQMGRHAESALPQIREIIDADLRFVNSGIANDIIDDDESFQETARVVLAKIEAELG